MNKIRVRSIVKGTTSPWVYTQEQTKQNQTEPMQEVKIMKAAATQPIAQSRTNQYGRFRYNELQYGIIERLLLSSIEISKVPIRIKGNNGEWVYFQQTNFNGASPAIRLRNINNNLPGPWVYVQNEEV